MNLLLELRDAPGERLFLLHHGPGEEARFALNGAKQRAASRAGLCVIGDFQCASAVQLTFEVEHAAHFVEVFCHIAVLLIRTRWRHAHRAPPAAITLVPSSA